MRRRNKIFENSEKNYNYGPFGVLIETVGAEVRQLIRMIDCYRVHNIIPLPNLHVAHESVP